MASAERTNPRLSAGSILPLTAISLRRLRFEGAATAVLAGVVLLTSFAAVSLPRFLNDVSDEALRTAVRDAAPINRNISVERGTRIPVSSTGDVFQNVIDAGTDVRAEFSDPVNDIIGDQRYVADTTNFEVGVMPGEPFVSLPRFLRIRYQQDAEANVTLVEGRMPAPAEPMELELDEGQPPVSVPVHEVAFTAETAERMLVGVGDSMLITPQREDPLNQGLSLNEISYSIVATVTGIIEIDDPEAEYWYGDTRLHEPFILETPDFVIIFGMGLMAPENYQPLLDDTSPSAWNYGWRYFVDPDSFNAGEIDQITADLQSLEVQFGSSALTRVGEDRFRTGLVRIANVYRGQRQLTLSMLSLVIAGTIIVAVSVTALLGALIAARRRDSTLLSRSRGASGQQIGGAELLESLIVFAPVALIGMVLATLLIPGRSSGFVVVIALGVAALAAGLVLLLALPDIRGDIGAIVSERLASDQRGRYRLVIESLIVVAAIGGLVLFRRRGLEAGSLSDPDQGFDPFLTSVPILLTLAIGVVLLRLYPLPVRIGGWFGSLRRGAVIFVGFRRIIQQPLAARLPLVVMLVATGLAVFASVVLFSITEGQQNSTWQEVGADYRLQSVRENAPISSRVDLSEIDDIEATAGAAVLATRDLTAPFRTGNVTLVAIDTEEYQVVVEGTRADPNFPESMLIDQNVQEIGTESNPIPVLVSEKWAGDIEFSTGDTLNLEVKQSRFVAVVRGVRERFGSVDPNEAFVIMPRGSLEVINPELDLRSTFIYIKAPSSANDEIVETVRGQTLATEFVSRPELLDEIANAPLVDGVETGFRAVAILATLYAVLAALAGIALTARERARDLGYLRTLGLTSRQAGLLTAIEQLPPAAVATTAGAGLGILMVWLVEPGLDLTTFAGTTLPASIVIDGSTVAIVAGVELLTVVIAIAVYSYLTRRMQLGDVLRLGDRT